MCLRRVIEIGVEDELPGTNDVIVFIFFGRV